MRKLVLALAAMLVVSAACVDARAATIPTWIRQNTVVAYDFFSAALLNGVPVSGQSLTGIQQFTVTGATTTAVSGIAQAAFNGIVDTYQFSCNAFGGCTGYPAQFWVDPADPTHSMFGPNGEPFSIIGTAPFIVAGITWTATTMAYTNAATGVRFTTIFDVNSGLILELSQVYPSQEVILALRGLAGATLPTTPPSPNPTPPSGTTSVVSSVLPTSRSVQVGATATAFAAIINAGSNTGTNCGLAAGNVPATFVFQTTNPTTNVVTGTANALVNIPPGQLQTFVIAFKPGAAFAPTDVAIRVSCDNSPAAPIISGVSTLLLSASTAPVPDIIALAATTSNDGIITINGTNGANAFAVATINVGVSANIVASADTGAANLSLNLAMCQSNPTNGQCISPIGSNVATTINATATPTFSIFSTAAGAVTFDPANNRIFVRFKDASGVTRGSTSVAVRTQ